MNPFDNKKVILNALRLDNKMATFKMKKAGINLAEQKKLDEKYDAAEENGTPEKIMQWIHEVLGREHQKCVNSSWRKLQFWLRDGVVLCKLINSLNESFGFAPVRYQGNAHITLVAQNNLDSFFKAAKDFGLDSTHFFQSQDLHEPQKSNFYNVIICLDQLGKLANSKSFNPSYKN